MTVDRGVRENALRLGENAHFHTTDRLVENERLVGVPGSPVLAVLWDEIEADGSAVPHYAISLDGATVRRVTTTSYDLKLRHGHFDPAVAVHPVAESLRAPAESEVYIVQFVTQPLAAYRQALRDLRATIYNYLPKHAYLVRMTPGVKTQVEALDFVRWVGPYHPAYKMADDLRADLLAGFSSDEAHRYSILVHKPGEGRMAYVRDEITAAGGVVHMISPETNQMESSLTIDQVRRIISLDEVAFIGRRGVPAPTMNIAREISGANYVESVAGFSGEGVRGEVLDEGIRLTHDAFAHPNSNYPILHCANGLKESHGTQVYGQVFGDGTGSGGGTCNPDGTGILPDGEGIFSSFYSFFISPCNPPAWNPSLPCTRSRFHHTAQLVGSGCCPDPPGDCPYDAVFQTNSWGLIPSRMDYDVVSAETDDILFTLDLLMCHSQGNDGATQEPRNSKREAWSKNVLSVGGIYHFDVECRDDDFWCPECPPSNPACSQSECMECTSGCASSGAAPGGRVKPDLVHFYDNIYTTCDGNDTCYTDGNPVPFSGTSAATPITCGHMGLIFQMSHEGVFCNSGGGATVFDSRPHMTTAKVLAINTAYQYGIGSAQHNDMTRFNQGWGMIDVKNLYALRERLYVVDESQLLTETQQAAYTIKVDSGEPGLKVTLVYADPPGTPLSTVNVVNNLSLKVCAPATPACSGTVYWGNCGLLEENWSSTGCSADHPYPSDTQVEVIDNVENVFIQNPAAGDWTIVVSADEVNQDGHVEYVNDDPTECCQYIPESTIQNPWEICENPDAQPDCIESSADDADFALVISGASNKRACCPQPSGPCVNQTKLWCESRGGIFHCDRWCPTYCEGTQGPQGP